MDTFNNNAGKNAFNKLKKQGSVNNDKLLGEFKKDLEAKKVIVIKPNKENFK